MTRLLQHVVSAPTPSREAEIAALGPWFHNLHLPDGAQTAPAHQLGDFPRFKWRQLAAVLPDDLTGWTALDVGCNAGFYTFELARRGAHVTGVDVEPLFLRQAEWAAGEFGLTDRVRFECLQVYDLARETTAYDLVLFMGLFYHLRYPLLGLDIVARRARRMLVFQSMTIPGDDPEPDTARDRDIMDRDVFRHPGWPRMAFIEHQFSGDPTNWWVPNRAGVEAMLRAANLRVVHRPGDEMYVCVPGDGDPDRAELSAAVGAVTGGAALR